MESFWPVLAVVLVGLAVAAVVWRRRQRAQHPPVSAGAQCGEPAAAAGDSAVPSGPAAPGAPAASGGPAASGDSAVPSDHAAPGDQDASCGAEVSGGSDTSECAGAAEVAGAVGRRRCERHCEQAVQRCLRAVEAVTAESARSELAALVRRMDAELPTVRALVALADELAAGSDGRTAVAHVDAGLAEAARGFDALAAEVLALIDELPRLPGRQRTSERTARLRSRFPLAPPMSAVTRVGEAGAAGERGGQPLRAG
ncbi:hypothetical protein GCM10027174_36690 [Salinifilum aidingensis]